MISTDDAFVVMRAEAQGHTAMRTAVAGNDQLTAHPVGHQWLIEQLGLEGRRADLGALRDGIPAAGQYLPVAGVETAGSRERRIAVHHEGLVFPDRG
jgi:hypothetical protein